MDTAKIVDTTNEKDNKKGKKKSSRLPKIISREDAKKLLAVPNVKTRIGLRNRVILELLYRCGLRVSEVCNMTVNDIDMEGGFLMVQLGKGGKDRNLPMEPETMEWIAKWAEIRPECPEDTDYLFPTLSGTQLDQRYVRDMVYRCSEKAGVYVQDGKKKKKVHPHILRSCYATEVLEEGLNIVEVQALLGHSSIQTTAIYTKVRPVALAEKIRHRQRI